MRVKLKTLKNVVVDLDLPTDTSVQKIKEAGAASEHGKAEGWDPEGMKLIYQGKIMDNAKDMASYNVQEDDFMVVMAAKPKKRVSFAIESYSEKEQEIFRRILGDGADSGIPAGSNSLANTI